MTTKMITLIEQFAIVDGVWHNAPHNQAAVREPKRSKPGKGSLFVLVEAQGQLSQLDVVEAHLVALVRDNYYPANGGVTASLRRVIQTANRWLFEQNGATTPDKQVIAGIVVVVIRDEDLFVAQTGPAALFSSAQKRVQRYPESSSWLDHDDYQASMTDLALGMHHFSDPRINHLQLQAQDVVILTDGRLARHLSLVDIEQTLRTNQIEAISQNLATLIQAKYGSALIIQVADGSREAQAPPLLQNEKVPIRMEALSEKGFNFAMPSLLEKPLRLITSKPSGASSASDGADIDFEEDDHDLTWDNDDQPNSPRVQGLGRIGAGLMSGFALLGSGLYTLLRLVLPSTQASSEASAKGVARPPITAMKHPSQEALKYVAIGLPIGIILIVLGVYWYRGYNRENEYAAKITEAQQKFSQAQSASPAAAVTLLAEAEQQLIEAATLTENPSEVASLRASIISQRDIIGQVERLYYVPELRRYSEAGTTLMRIVVQGVDIYVLDTGLDRLFHHRLDDIGDTLLPDEGTPLLLERGQSFDGVATGEIVDMVWMPAAGGRQTSDLLVLTRGGLLEFNPDWGGSPIPINGIETWQSPVAVSSYFGNFYLLDNQANRINRYWPTANGYENPAESYFSEAVFVDLNGAIDIAIDGSIYVLYQQGEIKKFLGGEPAPFEITGLDIPLANPTAIFTAPDEQVQYLYVADAGNRRIVQLSKEGAFMRQFKPQPEDETMFADLRSIYVDEISEKMFILSGESLYAPNIPVK